MCKIDFSQWIPMFIYVLFQITFEKIQSYAELSWNLKYSDHIIFSSFSQCWISLDGIFRIPCYVIIILPRGQSKCGGKIDVQNWFFFVNSDVFICCVSDHIRKNSKICWIIMKFEIIGSYNFFVVCSMSNISRWDV